MRIRVSLIPSVDNEVGKDFETALRAPQMLRKPPSLYKGPLQTSLNDIVLIEYLRQFGLLNPLPPSKITETVVITVAKVMATVACIITALVLLLKVILLIACFFFTSVFKTEANSKSLLVFFSKKNTRN
jgi:hypothetical protein